MRLVNMFIMCCAGLGAWSQTLEFSQVKLVTNVETVPEAHV